MEIFTDTWKPIDKAAEILGIAPNDIELLISGIAMCASNQQTSLRLVNLKEIGNFLKEIRRINEQLFAEDGPTDNGNNGKMIKGRQASKIMLISYDSLVKLCEKGTIPAQRKARGWRIEERVIKNFMLSNPDTLASLRDNSPAKPKREIGLIARRKPTDEGKGQVEEPGTKMVIRPTVGLPDNSLQDSHTIGGSPPEGIGTDPPPDRNGNGDNPLPAEDKIGLSKGPTSPDQRKDNPPQSEDDEDEPAPDDSEEAPEKKQEVHNIRVREQNGKPYCWIREVAAAFNPSKDTSQMLRWINNKQVEAIQVTEHGEKTWYIELESLKAFFDRNDILATFSGITKPRKPI